DLGDFSRTGQGHPLGRLVLPKEAAETRAPAEHAAAAAAADVRLRRPGGGPAAAAAADPEREGADHLELGPGDARDAGELARVDLVVFGVEVQVLVAGLVVKDEAVEVLPRVAAQAARLDPARRRQLGQPERRHVFRVVHAADDERPVRVAVGEGDDHL